MVQLSLAAHTTFSISFKKVIFLWLIVINFLISIDLFDLTDVKW